MLKFHIVDIVNNASKFALSHVDGVTINLPFVTFNFKPNDNERRVARAAIIYLHDKRFFDPRAGDEHNIKNEIGSLKNIRQHLNEKQIELADCTESGLFLILELMLAPIRQFLTYHENKTSLENYHDIYHGGYKMLQDHLCSCISQVYIIADIELPEVYSYFKYDGEWNLDAYEENV